MSNGNHHHPQIIDEDVEIYKTKLESSIMKFKTEAINDFMAIK